MDERRAQAANGPPGRLPVERIGEGEIKPEIIISHRMSLADAAQGYATFDKAQDDCRKVVLVP